MAVDDGEVDALRLAPLELRFERLLGALVLGEQHQAGRVAVDAVHDERPPPAALPEIALEILEHRRRVVAPAQWERHGEETRRLVEDDERIVLVDDAQLAIVARRESALRAAGAIHPQADDV